MGNLHKYSQKIVTIGGGTGQFTLLRGLVNLNDPSKIMAIPGSWDGGGSSGQLRIEQGILPPGDYMQCVEACMEDPEQLRVAISLLNDRSEGHPYRNILAAKAEKEFHSVQEGIDALRFLFRVQAKIIPSSLDNLKLFAETKNGLTIEGEESIDHLGQNTEFHPEDEVSRIYFNKEAQPNPKAIEAILQADKIVFAPGSPYTSSMAHLLIEGFAEAIMQSNAILVAVLNLMTTKGEDHHFHQASDWLKAFNYYLSDTVQSDNESRLNYILANTNGLTDEIKEHYSAQGQKPIEVDDQACHAIAPNVQIVRSDIAHYNKKAHLYRHDSTALAEAILTL